MRADEPEVGFVDAARAHPEHRTVGIRCAAGVAAEIARADVAVRETADSVEQLDVTQLTLFEDVLDRERSGQEIERVERTAGAEHLRGLLVARPEVLGQVGDEVVRDHELRRRERLDARKGEPGELGVGATRPDAVDTLFEGDEPNDEAVGCVAHHHHEVGERADEQRIPDPQQFDAVFGHLGQLGDRDHERRRGLAPVRPGRVGVDRMQHDVGRGARRVEP